MEELLHIPLGPVGGPLAEVAVQAASQELAGEPHLLSHFSIEMFPQDSRISRTGDSAYRPSTFLAGHGKFLAIEILAMHADV